MMLIYRANVVQIVFASEMICQHGDTSVDRLSDAESSPWPPKLDKQDEPELKASLPIESSQYYRSSLRFLQAVRAAIVEIR